MNQQAIGGWHVLYVKSRQEKKAHLTLSELQIESFLPLVKQERQWSDRKKIIEVPLFPSYLFVKINNKFDYEKVMQIKESCFYLKIGSEYAKATDKEIRDVKLFLTLDKIENIKTDAISRIKIGNSYMLENGPFKGFNCEICQFSGKHKVVVRVNSLSQNITAILPAHYIIPIKLS